MLYATICSFCEQNTKEKFEIIICDDGSQDTIDRCQLEQLELEINYIYSDHKGRAVARNRGLQEAKGDFIIFSDDDTLVDYNFVNRHLQLHSQYKNMMILGNRKQLYLKDIEIRGINRSNAKAYIERFQEYAKDDVYSRCTREFIFQRNPSSHWICSTTGNMSIERNWIQKQGGFDEAFYGWGFEDIELGYRYSKEGMKFYFDDRLVSYHMEHPRNKKDLICEMQRNIKYFYDKYGGSPDIKYYWDFYRGTMSLEEYDAKTLKEHNVNNGNTYFDLFKRSRLPELK